MERKIVKDIWNYWTKSSLNPLKAVEIAFKEAFMLSYT